MWRLDGLHGGLFLVAESVEALELGERQSLGEGEFGMGGDVGRGLDQSLGATLVTQIDLGKCF